MTVSEERETGEIQRCVVWILLKRLTLRRKGWNGYDGWIWEGAWDGTKGIPGSWRKEDDGEEGFGGLDEQKGTVSVSNGNFYKDARGSP